jgi:hypothetical protein
MENQLTIGDVVSEAYQRGLLEPSALGGRQTTTETVCLRKAILYSIYGKLH